MENICFLQLSYRAREIFSKFLCSKATTPVNIDSQAQLADDILNSPHPDMFKEQQLQVTTESITSVHLCLLSFHVKCYEMSKTIFSCWILIPIKRQRDQDDRHSVSSIVKGCIKEHFLTSLCICNYIGNCHYLGLKNWNEDLAQGNSATWWSTIAYCICNWLLILFCSGQLCTETESNFA